MLICLLRHGLTEYNSQRRYQGVLDIPLSPAGRAALCRADISPRRVYVSPLVRTGETAALLFPGAEQVVVSDLREMDFGAFEGRSAQEMARDPDYRAWVEGGCLAPCPGGEGREEFSARTCAAFERLMALGEDPLVVVAHGGTQMALLERYGSPPRPYHQWLGKNGGGFLLRADRWAEEKKLELVREICYTREL